MSKPRHLKYAREAARQAEGCGLRDIRIERQRRHAVLVATAAGCPVRVTLDRNTGNWRTEKNTLALMRRLVRGGRA